MTPAAAIAMLDRQLAEHGGDILLTRAAPAASTTVRAQVRGYSGAELAGSIQQGDSRVILSPTQLNAAAPPWLPQRDDKAVIDGKTFNIEDAVPTRLAGVLVRLDLQVRG
ncbi:MAG TPA: hypothetical protein VGO34_14900 [Alphaproteobacteria bacterium]|jgi:hypothetical protein